MRCSCGVGTVPALMHDLVDAFTAAFQMLVHLDPDLFEIIGRSLEVSLGALLLAAVVGFPLGAAVALLVFPGRRVAAVLQT